MNIRISPHDLRRYSATYASRNGVPLEVVSKVILRHQDLKTTQVYLGKISDTEAIRWMDIIGGNGAGESTLLKILNGTDENKLDMAIIMAIILPTVI